MQNSLSTKQSQYKAVSVQSSLSTKQSQYKTVSVQSSLSTKQSQYKNSLSTKQSQYKAVSVQSSLSTKQSLYKAVSVQSSLSTKQVSVQSSLRHSSFEKNDHFPALENKEHSYYRLLLLSTYCLRQGTQLLQTSVIVYILPETWNGTQLLQTSVIVYILSQTWYTVTTDFCYCLHIASDMEWNTVTTDFMFIVYILSQTWYTELLQTSVIVYILSQTWNTVTTDFCYCLHIVSNMEHSYYRLLLLSTYCLRHGIQVLQTSVIVYILPQTWNTVTTDFCYCLHTVSDMEHSYYRLLLLSTYCLRHGTQLLQTSVIFYILSQTWNTVTTDFCY
ncbi:hypothetical protein Btru_002278 [Bulinus truncatus]|nr:hypothetical protein Btru_002278 [Bulinus truncatus]